MNWKDSDVRKSAEEAGRANSRGNDGVLCRKCRAESCFALWESIPVP